MFHYSIISTILITNFHHIIYTILITNNGSSNIITPNLAFIFVNLLWHIYNPLRDRCRRIISFSVIIEHEHLILMGNHLSHGGKWGVKMTKKFGINLNGTRWAWEATVGHGMIPVILAGKQLSGNRYIHLIRKKRNKVRFKRDNIHKILS